MFSRHQSDQFGKALPVQVSHRFAAESAVFDEGNLVSCAGLVPVMALAEQTGLRGLLADKVHITAPRIKSGSANPAPKLATLIAGMCAGADCIDDIDVIRSGGMKTVFGGVYAPSTVGTLLREFTFGHARQLESVLREHLVALCRRVELLPGADEQVFVDIDSLLRPVYGHAKQGASYGHTKIAGKPDPAQGTLPAGGHDQHPGLAPVIAGMRLRAGKTGSGKGAGRMVAQAIKDRSRCGSERDDPGARRLGLRQPQGGAGVPTRRCPVLPGDDPQPSRRPRDHRDRRRRVDSGAAIPARSATPTPVPGSLMPRSPKSATPLSLPPQIGSPPGWWCAGSRTPDFPTRCSRCGDITRSSPTPTSAAER